MTKKSKVILSTCLITPMIVGTTIALTSCGSTYPFVKPSAINLNSSLTQIDNLIKPTHNRLNNMTDFNEVFKIQDEIFTSLNSESFNFNNNVNSVNINITPEYLNGTLVYKYQFEITFKIGIQLSFNNTSGYSLNKNRLLSPKLPLYNANITNDTNSIYFWISDANVIDSTSYIAIDSNNDNFLFWYNNENFNINKYKQINTPISTFTNIKVFINNVINDTYGNQWLSVNEQNQEISLDKKPIAFDVSYRTKTSTENISTASLETTQHTFNITATQSTNN